jgi:hypothetical protein
VSIGTGVVHLPLLRAERGHVPTPARSLSVHIVQRGSVSNGAGHLRAPAQAGVVCTESAIHAYFWRLPRAACTSALTSQMIKCDTGMAERQRAGPWTLDPIKCNLCVKSSLEVGVASIQNHVFPLRGYTSIAV